MTTDPKKKLEKVDYSEEFNVRKLHESLLREKKEPKEGMEPISLWFIGLFVVLVFWAGAYLLKYSGGFRADVYDERAVVYGPAATGPAKPLDPIKLGKKYYTANCAACHQATGLGSPGLYPPLAGATWVTGDINRLGAIVLNGLDGPVEVQGQIFDGAMLAWKDVLSDEQIAGILTYIRKSWGNEASNVTPEQVAELRSQYGERMDTWSAEELLALS